MIEGKYKIIDNQIITTPYNFFLWVGGGGGGKYD